MSRMLGEVGAQRVSDGGLPSPVRLGSYGEVLTGGMNGFFAEQVGRGNGYVFTTAAAGNALVAATTTNAPAIWNPPGSGRVLVLEKITFGRTAKGTPLEGSILYLTAQNVNSFGATGSDIVSATFVAAKNLRIDLGDNSGMRFVPTTIATTFTPSVLAATGIAQTADNGATTVSGPHLDLATVPVNGLIQLMPGTYFALGASAALSTTYTISIFALSLQLPVYA